MSDAAPLAIACQGCGLALARVEMVDEGRVRFDLYRCSDPACARKVAVLFEPVGGLAPEEESFVKREIARRGAFFPSDLNQGGSGGGFGRL